MKNISRRKFTLSAAMVACGGAVDRDRTAVASAIDHSPPTPQMFGANIIDDDEAFEKLLADSRSVYWPAGVYVVNTIKIPANTTIKTDGLRTVIRQKAGTGSATPVIRIAGSNVDLGDVTIIGNIDSDSDEQNHGVFIRGDADIRDIRIGNIYGENIRGDVVYVGGLLTAKVTGLQGGRIYADNVLRNGVSITGGEDIRFEAVISMGRVGYAICDVEPNPNSQFCNLIHFGYVKGRQAMVGGGQTYPVGHVTYDTLDLDPAFQTNSIPAYFGFSSSIGYGAFTIQNFGSIEIRILRAHNHGWRGINHSARAGDTVAELLVIGWLEESGLGQGDITYNSYNIFSADFLKRLVVRGGKATLHDCAMAAFQGAPLDLQDFWCNGRVGIDCRRPRLLRVTIESTWDVYVMQESNGGDHRPTFERCVIDFTGAVGRLTNIPGAVLIDCEVTVGAFLVNSGIDAVLINTKVNGVLTSFGTWPAD